jgi:predicted outer membrane repeat protein
MKDLRLYTYLVLLFFVPTIVSAATFNVTNTLDDGSSGSFRWAINQANGNGAGSDDITVITSGTVTLTSDLPVLTSDVIISGNNLTIDGNGMYSALSIQDNINDPDINVTINNLIIINCSGSKGSALYVHTDGSVVMVNDCEFNNNVVTDKGGAIWNRGILTINDSEFNGNQATQDGGAILMNNNDGSLTINECVFDGNSALDQGGAISVENGGMATINMSTFIANLSPNDDAGAIYISDGTVDIYQSTFYDNNSGDGGGALQLNDGMLTMENSTLSGNIANGRGGAIRISGGTVDLISVTMTENTASSRGGGVAINSGTTLNISNSILALNLSNSTGQDIYSEGTLISSGFNIVFADDQNIFTPMLSDMEGVDPELGPLADNGGPTMTHALQFGSPAFENGGNCLSVDQRDIPRPGVNCSIGAFEGQLAPIPTMSQWGILILGLLLAILSLAGIKAYSKNWILN